VQVYLRDVVGSTTRPFRELRAFERVELGPGESRRLAFPLSHEALSHCDASGRRVTEPGRFEVYVGNDSGAPLGAHFEVTAKPPP
jgi:beta-glucosidase